MKSKIFCSFIVLSAFCEYICANDDVNKADVQQELAVAEEEDIVPATGDVVVNEVSSKTQLEQHDGAAEIKNIDVGPQIKEILPIANWNRCMADTASSITEWKRWWTYLKMKDPVVMNWIDGLKLKIYPKNEIFRSIYVNGKYDPNMIVVLKSFLKSGDTLIDVGANCGYISLPLTKTIGSTGRIVAIEPSTRDYKRLTENIALNKLSEVVKPVKLAMGDRIGHKTMLIASEERSGSNTLGMKFAFQGIEKETTEDVNVSTIDNVVNMENITQVNVIKLDVEGSEVRCLEGAKDTIAKFKPTIVISVNGDALAHSKRSIEQLEKILKDYNYEVFGLEKNKFALQTVNGLQKLYSPIIVCLPAGTKPVALPAAENMGVVDKVKRFFK